MIHLDDIRLKRVTRGELAFYKEQANRDYAEAFEQAGLGTSRDRPSLVGPQPIARLPSPARPLRLVEPGTILAESAAGLGRARAAGYRHSVASSSLRPKGCSVSPLGPGTA